MCGIAGLVQFDGLNSNKIKSALNNMLVAMHSRGPDSNGSFFSNDGNVALGHTRLAIIDRTSSGHQPMLSEDKRFVISYNGELFGYQNLKYQLGGYYQGNSDTEVLLKYLSVQKNIGASLSQLDGMFAFALYNQSNNELILARDQFGIKPLYYYMNQNFLVFASEPWALLSTGLVEPEISSEFFPLLTSVKMEAELEDTWYKNIKQLMPASILTLNVKTGKFSLQEYWSPNSEEFVFSPERLKHAFSDALIKRIPADVERAAFLSGGVDSSAIVSELTQQNVNILACTLSYKNEPESEDSQYAKAFAMERNIRFKEIVVDPDKINLLHDAINAVQRPILHGGEMGLLMAYEQISQLGIKVCYSGHGADELWGYQEDGYFPLLSRSFSPDMHSEYYLRKYYFCAHHTQWAGFLNNIIYPAFSIHQDQMEDLIWDKIFSEYRRAPFIDPHKKGRFHMLKRFLLYVNNMVDRTSMYYSVEDRPIFQNIEMCKLAFALPEYIKNREGISNFKPFLKQAFSSLLPDNILNRSKVGFQPPRHELFRTICLDILADRQPFNLKINLDILSKFHMNELLFLASSQLIFYKLNLFKQKFIKGD